MYLISFIVVMVVKTRSYNRQVAAADAAAAAAAEPPVTENHNNRRVKIMTPSFRDASIRTYKLYSSSRIPKQSSLAKEDEVEEEVEEEVEDEDEVEDDAMMTTADTLVALQDENTQSEGCITATCMNPMRPITRFMYCIRVYNREITLHYKTAYILYDNKTRLYHVYSIISNCVPETAYTDTGCGGGGCGCVDGYPAPAHTVQMKYTTYISETIVNYIMTMIVPSDEYDYFIKDDIVGIVASKEEINNTAFSEDSSYYDIDHLFHDNTSRETVYGWKTIQLIPSRTYRVDTTDAAATGVAAAESRRSPYTESVANSVLLILSQSM